MRGLSGLSDQIEIFPEKASELSVTYHRRADYDIDLEIRENHRLNDQIERFIEAYDGTIIGQEVRNMYENGTSYESICDRMGMDVEDFID